MDISSQASTAIAATGLIGYLTSHRIVQIIRYCLSIAKVNQHASSQITTPEIYTSSGKILESTNLSELKAYKELYYKLQRLEEHTDVLPEARDMLLKLLSDSLISARAGATERSILNIEHYSSEALEDFLACGNEW